MSRIMRNQVVEHFAPCQRKVPMLFDGRLVNPGGAALAGDITIDALDAHDGHKLTKGHVG